jgi:hypothetical protein
VFAVPLGYVVILKVYPAEAYIEPAPTLNVPYTVLVVPVPLRPHEGVSRIKPVSTTVIAHVVSPVAAVTEPPMVTVVPSRPETGGEPLAGVRVNV